MRETPKTAKALRQELATLRQRYTMLEALLALSPTALETSGQKPAWYQPLVEHGPGLLYMHDLEGVLLFVNPAAAHALGVTAHEGIGRPLSDFLAPATRPLFTAYLTRIRQEASARELLHILTRAGEERAWLADTVRYEQDGRSYVLSHAQDITEYVQREAALLQEHAALENRVVERTRELQRAQERFIKAFHASPDAIMLTGMDGRYIDVNPSFQRLSGYKP